MMNTFNAFLTNGDRGIGAVLPDLEGFVAQFAGCYAVLGQNITSGVASIPPGKHGHPQAFGMEKTKDMFDMGGLTRSAYREVSHTDDGRGKGVLAQDAPVEKFASHRCHGSEKKGQRREKDGEVHHFRLGT